MSSSSLSNAMMKHQRRLLPEHYVLHECDVHVGRGSHCFNHEGNRTFRRIIQQHLDRYVAAVSKYEKSAIINEVVTIVRDGSPSGGGFVKRDTKTGRFYEVGDFLAREKTSQAFRDAIQETSKKPIQDSNNKRTAFSRMRNEERIFSRAPFSCPTLNTQAPMQPMVISASDCYLASGSSLLGNNEFPSYCHQNLPSKCTTSTANKKFGSIFDAFRNNETHSWNRNDDIVSTKETIKQRYFGSLFESNNSKIWMDPIRKGNGSNVTCSTSAMEDFSTNARNEEIEASVLEAAVWDDGDMDETISFGDCSSLTELFHTWSCREAAHRPPSLVVVTNLSGSSPITANSTSINNPNVSSSNMMIQKQLKETSNATKVETIPHSVYNNDDTSTFDILLQLTETYPNLESCPFLQLDYP